MSTRRGRWLGAAMLALGVTGASDAQATNPIYTGDQRGSYFGEFGPLLLDVLDSYFFDYELHTSAGSGENIQRVLDSPQAIGMTQSDVLAFEIAGNPAIAEQIVIIRNDIAQECLFAVTNEENAQRLTNWGDVRAFARRLRFALGPEAGGSARTFGFLQTLDERLATARNVAYLDSTDAAIRAVINGEADIAFFVQFADTGNPLFETINDSRLAFIPVIDRAILRQQFQSGERAYMPLEVTVTSAGLLSWRGVERVTTACTPLAYITGNPDALAAGSDARLDLEDMISVVREADIAELQPS